MNVDSHNHWINEIKKYVDLSDEEIIKYSLSCTLQSLKGNGDMSSLKWSKKDIDGEKKHLKKVYKKIIIGDVHNDYVHKTPIQFFELAVKLSKKKQFIVHTNNPQFVEALEVLCGENNVNIYRKFGDRCDKICFKEAYDYLGDVYDIVDLIRLKREDNDTYFDDYEFIKPQIIDYKRNDC